MSIVNGNSQGGTTSKFFMNERMKVLIFRMCKGSADAGGNLKKFQKLLKKFSLYVIIKKTITYGGYANEIFQSRYKRILSRPERMLR